MWAMSNHDDIPTIRPSLCPHCHGDISGEPECEACPECDFVFGRGGIVFTADQQDVVRWKTPLGVHAITAVFGAGVCLIVLVILNEIWDTDNPAGMLVLPGVLFIAAPVVCIISSFIMKHMGVKPKAAIHSFTQYPVRFDHTGIHLTVMYKVSPPPGYVNIYLGNHWLRPELRWRTIRSMSIERTDEGLMRVRCIQRKIEKIDCRWTMDVSDAHHDALVRAIRAWTDGRLPNS
jgi:hypothetical protein